MRHIYFVQGWLTEDAARQFADLACHADRLLHRNRSGTFLAAVTVSAWENCPGGWVLWPRGSEPVGPAPSGALADIRDRLVFVSHNGFRLCAAYLDSLLSTEAQGEKSKATVTQDGDSAVARDLSEKLEALYAVARKIETGIAEHTPVKPGSDRVRNKKPKASAAQNRLLLLHALLAHHRSDTEEPNWAPASESALAKTLGWSQSTVSRTMEAIFGKAPMYQYRRLCSQDQIAGFLRKRDDGSRDIEAIDSHSLMQ